MSELHAGVDLGSRDVKVAVLDGESKLVFSHIEASLDFYKLLRVDPGYLQQLTSGAIITTTGYGKIRTGLGESGQVSELMAHAAGAVFQTGIQDMILFDVGGQDFKVMLIRNGKMRDMAANARCAASSGRFLENMARMLDLSLEELQEKAEEPILLDSVCAVFAESEMLAHLANGEDVDRLAAGVNLTLVRRQLPFAQRMLDQWPELPLVIVGGTAKNSAVVHFFGAETGRNVLVPDAPHINAALGCAVLGRDK